MNIKEQSQKTPLEEFFAKAKKYPWVVDIYHAIQAAMSFGVKDADDFERLADKLQPRPDRIPGMYYGIGEEGLELLGMIYVCECVKKGMTNYHEYRFTRIADGKTVVGTIKI